MMYNLEFKLPSISKQLRLPIDPKALDICSSKERAANVPTRHEAAAHSKIHQALLQSPCSASLVPTSSRGRTAVLCFLPLVWNGPINLSVTSNAIFCLNFLVSALMGVYGELGVDPACATHYQTGISTSGFNDSCLE